MIDLGPLKFKHSYLNSQNKGLNKDVSKLGGIYRDTEELGITSLQITEETGKTHPNVLKDIRRMFEGLEIDGVRFDSIYKDSTGRTLPMFILPRREAMILATGYNVKLRAVIIDKLDELEEPQKGLHFTLYSVKYVIFTLMQASIITMKVDSF